MYRVLVNFKGYEIISEACVDMQEAEFLADDILLAFDATVLAEHMSIQEYISKDKVWREVKTIAEV